MPQIGKRIFPPEGVDTKVGDLVTWEIIYDDGEVGTISTVISEFDRKIEEGALSSLQLDIDKISKKNK